MPHPPPWWANDGVVEGAAPNAGRFGRLERREVLFERRGRATADARRRRAVALRRVLEM